MKKTIISLSLILIMTVGFIVPTSNPFAFTVSAAEYVNRGIDVSRYNGNIDWDSVSNSNIDFAIIRAGSTNINGEILYKDSKFESNYSGAKDSGIKVGAYYYCGAYTEEGFKSNAYDFVELLDGKSFDLPVYIDLEQATKQTALGKQKLTEYALSALEIIRDAGYEAGVYANLNWYRNYIDASRIREEGYSIWMAQYPSGKYAVDPGKYDKSSSCDIWQYSSLGKVNGIKNWVDVNVAYVDYNNNTLTAPKIRVTTDGQIATISWNKVPAATHYDVRLYYSDGEPYYNKWGGDPDETEVSFKMDPGAYKVQVCSSDMYTGEFVYCNPVDFTIDIPLEAPEISVTTDGQVATVYWDKIYGATHYDVRIYYANGEPYYNKWGGDSEETEVSFKMDPGDYKVQVCSSNKYTGTFTYCSCVYFTINSETSFESYSSVKVSEGTYYFSPMCAPDSCIDAKGGEVLCENYNHNIHLWEYLGNSNQQFQIEYAEEKDGKKLYYIKNVLTKQYLTCGQDKNVEESPYKISLSKWYFIDCGNGYYKIVNYFNNLALDICSGESDNGTNAWCYDPSDMNNAAQLFKLNEVD